MEMALTRKTIRDSRRKSIRRRIAGTSERPRLCVRRSLKHVYAQLVDDSRGASIAMVSSLDKDIRSRGAGKKKLDLSRLVGEKLATLALSKGIDTVVFDRGGYLYHGRVKALADAVRAGGLKF